jgi:radical SAM-linked protein
MWLLIEFNVRGNSRYISHAETMKVFQRAFLRAGLKVVNSRGFNPHPRMSLPLPRSVGVESEGDIACVEVEDGSLAGGNERLCEGLCGQLPEGFDVVSVSTAEVRKRYEPAGAAYVLSAGNEFISDELKARMKQLLDAKSIDIQRRTDAQGRTRKINVRPFLKDIRIEGGEIIVECNITGVGSIRVEEITNLLGLEKGACSVKRRSIQWREGG